MNMMDTVTNAPNLMLTTEDLRRSLIDDLMALRGGLLTKAEARTRALVARSIIDTIKVELYAASLAMKPLAPIEMIGNGATDA